MNKFIPIALVTLMACSTAFAEQVKITGGGKTFKAELERTPLSAQLLDRLPAELKMDSLYSCLIWGDKAINATGDFRRGMKKGDIAYCEYGYFIIFTEDQPSQAHNGYIKVGQIDPADIEKLGAVSNGGKIRIEKVK